MELVGLMLVLLRLGARAKGTGMARVSCAVELWA